MCIIVNAKSLGSLASSPGQILSRSCGEISTAMRKSGSGLETRLWEASIILVSFKPQVGLSRCTTSHEIVALVQAPTQFC